MSNNPNAPVGLRLKQRSVLSFNTPGGMSRAMSQMRVLGTPGGPPGSQSQGPSQDPGQGNAGALSQPMGTVPEALPSQGPSGMMSQGMGGMGGMMSQGMQSQGLPMFTPDFITPVDAQFACNYDPNEKENKGPRSPVHLSPMRSKRPRFGFDPSQLSQDSQLGSQPVGSQPVGGWGVGSQGVTELSGRGENSGGGDDASVFRVPAPRAPTGGRAPLPRAAQSPPCLRNPFLQETEQPDETPAHARLNGASAAALATMSRLRADFVDCGTIGRGGFCKVFKVISRLDGSQYAVKRTERKLQSERERREALKEVQAMAGLGGGQETGSQHIVRYFGCWMEYDHLYIQLELCETTLNALFSQWIESGGDEGGDAGMETETYGREGSIGANVTSKPAPFSESEIKKVLRHVASALACAHARNVAHLDVKPDNILVKNGVYKLADWGRAAPVDGVGYVGQGQQGEMKKPTATSVSVEEGDSRYLAPELLRGDFHPYDGRERQSPSPYTSDQVTVVLESPVAGGSMSFNSACIDDPSKPSWFIGLDRADVFSLGATAFELASGVSLPSSGDGYQALRNGEARFEATGTEGESRFTSGLQNLILSMVAADPGQRPSAVDVLRTVKAMEHTCTGDGNIAGMDTPSRMDSSLGGVIGLFSPAVPDSTMKEKGTGEKSRLGMERRDGGTPSRLGFGVTGR